MISIDEHPPPDPSSSDYQNQQQVSHEALIATVSDIDLLKPNDATLDDTNNPHPNFTIRDYVYGSRCKNIARNWPFSHKSLQLCLNYSLNNFLPPFESLDSLRSNQSFSIFGVENHFPNEEKVTNFNRKSADDRFKSLTSSCVKSQSHLEEDLAHTMSNSQPTVKKCKLVMKSNSGTDPVEETVASYKVCPVSKTFSSSSNTTLNAHIDQCLSEDSSMKSTANPKIKMVKHRIKPRKTRLMVDIYKTAPQCTVEELDRRNGTSWATNSNFPDQELEFQAEDEKKEEPTFIPNVVDHEGAVYIDTNGTKVLILSINKLDDDNARKFQKGERGSKLVRGKKKMKAYGQKNRQKILKLSPNSKKATSGQKKSVATLGSHMKDGGENPMKAQANKQIMDNYVTTTRPPWACSKRTGVVKKRFPVLTKPKEGTHSSEDPSLNIIGSKGCKFSSLKKNVLVSASREQNAGSKLNLKRKFSALKKPQESWKQNSKMVKDTGEKSSNYENIVNVSEVKKKKSKRSNGNEDSSSGGVIHEITTASARIEVPFHSDYVGIEGNFMGLRNSLDDESSKINVGQLDNKFDPREGNIIDDIIMGQNTEKKENYLEAVDPLILIPGPPGFFLPPSPGADDMVSEEEVKGNSSLTTTSRLHSNELEDQRHHDLMKTDFISGDSPVSTVSSSPNFARSNLSSRLIITSQQNKKSVNSSVDHADSFTEKTPTPCCCSKSVPSYHQESPLELNLQGPANSMNLMMPDLFFSLKLPTPAETVKSPVLRLMGKNLTVVNTDDDGSTFKPPPCSSSHPQLHPPNCNYTSLGDLRSENMVTNAAKEVIMIDDSSENEGDHDHHMYFKESLIRNRAISPSSSLSLGNAYSNGGFQNTSSHLREVVNDGSFGRWVKTETRNRLFSMPV